VTDWVTAAVVLAIHDEQLAEHGGLSGIGDINLLESALARPQHLEACGDPPPDIAALAAAYAFGIAKNHAFVDGNKRTSYVVARTFLVLNGHDTTADELALLEVWERLGNGNMSEVECAEWLRTSIVKI
jgi:death-on-curing protein